MKTPTMREFLFSTLRDLDKLAGLKQFNQLAELPDSQVQIKDLLDKIMFIVDQFKDIPDKAKQDIIYAGVLTDQNFYGLNAKVVYKWLVTEAHKYKPKPVEEPVTEESKPLERGSEQYLKRLQEWEEALNKTEMMLTQRSDIYAKVREEWKPKDGIEYKSTLTEQDILRRELHIQYVRENYHPVTREKLEHWMPEDQWIELQKL